MVGAGDRALSAQSLACLPARSPLSASSREANYRDEPLNPGRRLGRGRGRARDGRLYGEKKKVHKTNGQAV